MWRKRNKKHWIFSKEIVLPADTNLLPHLFWRPSWLLTLDIGVYDHLRYSVMITTDSDYTDTTHYTLLYADNLRRSRFGFDDLLSASLADYAGQHIHIAFRSYPHHLIRTVTVHDQYINIDDVLIRTTEVPVVSVAADANRYYYGDTATFTATLIEGSRAGISYTWHSTLLDSTLTTTTGSLRLTYGLLDGSDTVSVVATNAYGSDTAQVVVRSQMITTPSVTVFSAEDKFFVSGLEKAEVGDTVDYLISRNNCITTGLAYSLHSTLLDTTVTVSTEAETARIPLAYTSAGIDTLTATIANIFDTTTSETYTWNDSVYTTSGIYTQVFSTEQGCDSVVMLMLTIINGGPQGIETPSTIETVKVYPNPTNGWFTVNADGLLKVDVIDNAGRLVETFSGTNKFDLSHLPTGNYLLRIKLQSGYVTCRIVKQ